MILYYTNGMTIQKGQEKYIKREWIEIESPVKEDGTLYKQHKNLHLCELDEDGNYYRYYQNTMTQGKYLKDDDKIQAENTEILQEQAKTTRDEAETSNIKVFEVEWQVREKDQLRMQKAIDTAIRQGRETESIGWILADNTIRMSTVPDLEAVLDAVTLRTEEIFLQYTTWRQGDKSEAFEYVEA